MRHTNVSNYWLMDRADFVQARYLNFQKKKDFFERHPDFRNHFHFTDLDKYSEDFKKKMGEVVVCDRCQKDIEDPQIVMVEGAFVYHYNCVSEELDMASRINVLPFGKFRR